MSGAGSVSRQEMQAGTGLVRDKVGTARSAVKKDPVRKAAEEFESIFLESVLKSMRKSVVKSGFIDGGNAEEIYRSMLDSEYAKSMAGQGQTGLADMIERQLKETSQVAGQQTVARHREALAGYREVDVGKIPSILQPKGR